jgi:hypothetical protein
MTQGFYRGILPAARRFLAVQRYFGADKPQAQRLKSAIASSADAGAATWLSPKTKTSVMPTTIARPST